VLSVREIALLVDSGQVELASPIEAWITRFLERPGIEPAASRGSNRLPQLSSLSARPSRSGGSASDLTKLTASNTSPSAMTETAQDFQNAQLTVRDHPLEGRGCRIWGVASSRTPGGQ